MQIDNSLFGEERLSDEQREELRKLGPPTSLLGDYTLGDNELPVYLEFLLEIIEILCNIPVSGNPDRDRRTARWNIDEVKCLLMQAEETL